MTLTVSDMTTLLGTSATGTLELNYLMKLTNAEGNEDDGTDPLDLNKKNKAYGTVMRNWRKTEGPVSDQEYLAFLLYWLCRYVFCVLANQVTKEYMLVAKALAKGTVLDLGPYILSTLYRSLGNLTNDILLEETTLNSNSGGSIWIVQLWLHAYFPELGYSAITPDQTDFYCYDHRLMRTPILNRSFESLFSFFFNLTPRDPKLFMPFIDLEYGPRFFKRKPIELSSDQSEGEKSAYTNLWSQYLVCRDLHRMTSVNGANNKCGVEIYAPHYCARQFCLTQSILVPVLFTANHNFLDRVIFTEKCQLETVDCVTEILKDDFFEQFYFFEEHPASTPLYDQWWETYV